MRKNRAHAPRLPGALPDSRVPRPVGTDDPRQRGYERRFLVGNPSLQERAAQLGFGVALYRRGVAESDPEIGDLRYSPRFRA